MLDLVVFYFFGALAIAAAIMVVTRRNVVHSAIFLATALLATAGIFLSLSAEFVFIVQIILATAGIFLSLSAEFVFSLQCLYLTGLVPLFSFTQIILAKLEMPLHQVQFT